MRVCRHPTCAELIDHYGYCPAHEPARTNRAASDKFYDRSRRNSASAAFYSSAAWRRARAKKLAKNPTCERCGKVFASLVHHVIPLVECTPRQRVDPDNLRSLCAACHGIVEAEAKCI